VSSSADPYQGGVGSRREARERTVALLYEAEIKSVTPAEVLAELPVEPEPFTVELLLGIGEHGPAIDELLRAYARDWKLDGVLPATVGNLLSLGEQPPQYHVYLVRLGMRYRF
jgi:N utilization substance protein B